MQYFYPWKSTFWTLYSRIPVAGEMLVCISLATGGEGGDREGNLNLGNDDFSDTDFPFLKTPRYFDTFSDAQLHPESSKKSIQYVVFSKCVLLRNFFSLHRTHVKLWVGVGRSPRRSTWQFGKCFSRTHEIHIFWGKSVVGQWDWTHSSNPAIGQTLG